MNRKKGIRILLTVLTVAVLLAAGGYALWKNGFFEKINSVEALREVIAGTGMWAGGVYFALQMMTVIIAPIPSNISMMAGALALGFWPAMILGVLAVGVGSVIVFLAARALGKKAVQRFLDKGVMDKYLPIIEEKQDMFLFLTMLFPFFPDDALCMLAGLTNIPLGRFVVIMALSRPWGLIVAALMGSGSISPADLGVGSHRRRRPVYFLFRDEIQRADREALLRFVRKIVPQKTKIDRK
ncbi:MAG: TVP38/TMEM64 family protein [Christensenellales bacterium]